ncbi:MAG: hypothetical protein V3V14_09945 [Saprospiraceae bacterium]
MNFEELAEEAKKENVIMLLVNMSKTDGHLHENELAYILKASLSMGINIKRVSELVVESNDYMYIPKSEMERMTILYYLIFLMRIDGEIQDKEEEMFHYFGVKLGFNPLMIGDVLKVVSTNLNTKLPLDAIINEMKKYLN